MVNNGKGERRVPKIKWEKLSKKVFEALKEMIANHRFEPGVRLNVEQLANELGVSRTPVWEAVSRLEQEGLVMNIPNRGVFMPNFTPEMALHFYEVREVLEGRAGRLAASRIDKKTLNKMERCLAKQRQTVREADLAGYSRIDFDFHAAVYKSCGNPYLQELLENIKIKMRPITIHISPILSGLYQDHLKIFEGLKAKDPRKAEAALLKHNLRVIRLIKKSIETKKPNESREIAITG